MNNLRKYFFTVATCLAVAASAQTVSAPSDLYYLRNAALTEATLYWTDNSSDETGFVVERKTDSGEWTEATTLNTNITEIKLTGLNPTESATYRVIAARNSERSAPSASVRLPGTGSRLEVYPEVPGIRNPKDTTMNGITFGMIQNQCPADPSKGKATRLSTMYSVEVRTASDTNKLISPVYETRPQIRNNKAQDDPAHSAGHRPYGYHEYGPSSGTAKKLHSIHWSNFDASENVVVRITLLKTGTYQGPININDLQIHPAPIKVAKVDDYTLDITLPGATNFTRHYRVCINKSAWAAQSGRSLNSFEAPLYIFVNPIQIAPASAPQNQIKTFNGGALVVYGAGIHLPNNNYRFFGTGGGNATCRELYAPGDAYIHGGYIFNNQTYAVKVYGRAIYSDEMYDIYNDIAVTDNYEYSSAGRTPWSTIDCTDGNPWGKNPTSWEGRVGFYCNYSQPTVFEGFTNIGGRMGTVNDGGNASIVNHKDVGYGGGTYQIGNGSKTAYKGCLLVNDDDITYVHLNYTMDHCTSTILHNGTTFQYGWGITTAYDVKPVITNHIALASDRGNGAGYGKNHGVFDTRLKLGQLTYHNGGMVDSFDVWGEENIVFQLRIWEEAFASTNTTSIFEDKTYRNINIHTPSRSKNVIWGDQNTTNNQKSYFRFLHFDNLMIGSNHIDNINDGNFFDYNNAVLLHTITFFSLPDAAPAPVAGLAPTGRKIWFTANNNKVVQADAGLPVSFSPLCANTTDTTNAFTVMDAGNGYVALKAGNGYYVKADTKRYGYIYTLPDTKRGDATSITITDDARFIWVDLGEGKFALYSKTMKRYLRAEPNCGPAMPLYAASATVGSAETFSIENRGIFTGIDEVVKVVPGIYPNPAKDQLTINGLTGNSSLILRNLQGKEVWTGKTTASVYTLKRNNLPCGTYIITVTSAKQSHNYKIVFE